MAILFGGCWDEKQCNGFENSWQLLALGLCYKTGPFYFCMYLPERNEDIGVCVSDSAVYQHLKLEITQLYIPGTLIEPVNVLCVLVCFNSREAQITSLGVLMRNYLDQVGNVYGKLS